MGTRHDGPGLLDHQGPGGHDDGDRPFDRLAVVLARQKPAWEPGTRQAYHAITLGYYESELLRRVDPRHRSLGQFFEDEIALPLGADFYIRLPESVPNSRLATLSSPGIGFGYVTSQVGAVVTSDPRGLALRNAVYSIVQPAA